MVNPWWRRDHAFNSQVIFYKSQSNYFFPRLCIIGVISGSYFVRKQPY